MNKRSRARRSRARNKPQKSVGSRVRAYSLMLVCAATLLCGFFFAARQHFASMDFGMKNSRLRKQVDELEAEKRRLLLAREVSLSPAEIKKAAKKTGLVSPAAPQDAMVAQVVSTTKEKAVPAPASDPKSMVIKTASVSPVQATAKVMPAKMDRSAKTVKTKISAD